MGDRWRSKKDLWSVRCWLIPSEQSRRKIVIFALHQAASDNRDNEFANVWCNGWSNDIMMIVARSYRSSEFGKIFDDTIHCFSDASSKQGMEWHAI